MSKESFIGGDYIETTGGSAKVYAKGNIENSSAKHFAQKGDDKGVFYTKNEDAPMISTPTVINAFFAKLDKDKYIRINSASVGDTVYLIVNTSGLIGRVIEANLKDADAILSDKNFGVVDLVQDGKDVQGLLSATVGKDI